MALRALPRGVASTSRVPQFTRTFGASAQAMPTQSTKPTQEVHVTIEPKAAPQKVRMTTEEAFIKVLQAHGIRHSFGIIGSAMMPISDLFPQAGIKFWDCAHEYTAGMMSDGYSRSTGRMSMMIAQNGPGIANFVTPVKTAYWNHTPLLLVTPQAANKSIGQGGFQEVEQMRMFSDCVCYQEEVRDPNRIAEVLNRVIEKAIRGSAPAQINIPRDFWTQVVEIALPTGVKIERAAGGQQSIKKAAEPKASQGLAASSIAPIAQWCVPQDEQAHYEHAEACAAIRDIGISVPKICAGVGVQARIRKGKQAAPSLDGH